MIDRTVDIMVLQAWLASLKPYSLLLTLYILAKGPDCLIRVLKHYAENAVVENENFELAFIVNGANPAIATGHLVEHLLETMQELVNDFGSVYEQTQENDFS